MASVVFQTLRESKALAYSVWGAYTTPGRPDQSHYVRSYIGTQADKLQEALDGMLELLDEMAESENALEDSRNSITKNLQTERITKASVLWRYERAKRMGTNDRDRRRDVYEQVPQMTMTELSEFFDEYIKGNKYTILVLGDVDKLDLDVLSEYGQVTHLSLEQLFGY
jgi:predicted Zn-dependent peptidase